MCIKIFLSALPFFVHNEHLLRRMWSGGGTQKSFPCHVRASCVAAVTRSGAAPASDGTQQHAIPSGNITKALFLNSGGRSHTSLPNSTSSDNGRGRGERNRYRCRWRAGFMCDAESFSGRRGCRRRSGSACDGGYMQPYVGNVY